MLDFDRVDRFLFNSYFEFGIATKNENLFNGKKRFPSKKWMKFLWDLGQHKDKPLNKLCAYLFRYSWDKPSNEVNLFVCMILRRYIECL